MSAPKGVLQLVEKFDQQLKAYRSPQYNEAQLRNEFLQRQIDASDTKIDQLVYQLYGLTDEEIRVVEEPIAPTEG
jgi:hypothetical protein